jgi:predicted Zn finger-like uncharacterized protein
MNVACPECRSLFRVDPAKITNTALRARCSLCGAIIPVGESVNWGDDIGAPAESAAVAPPMSMGVSPTPSRSPAVARGTDSDSGLGPSGRPLTPPFSAPISPAPQAERDAVAGVRNSPLTPRSLPELGRLSAEAGSPRPQSPAFGAPLAPPPRKPTLTPITGAGPIVPMTGDTATAAPVNRTPSGPAVVGGEPSARPPINPFLANDPNQKARRLARALVSDMVAYHPSKREDGLRGGTLKQLFREEIKKSYEEYVEQVGREFAESSTHFQDALNDVLAGGRKIF